VKWGGPALTSANSVLTIKEKAKMSNPNFQAIYFIMGAYNSDDNVPNEILGFDCPFDDSPVITAETESELTQNVIAAYRGETHIEEQIHPDVIVDSRGNLLPKLYETIFPEEKYNPDQIQYSGGKETLSQFLEREKWRWISDI
jgi:hypothetical protein